MKERPILFSGAMIRAILDGTKSQTRRVVKPQPDPSEYDGMYMWSPPGSDPSGPVKYAWGAVTHQRLPTCPYGQPGDRLWVRETWALVPDTAYRGSEGVQQAINPYIKGEAAIYRADWDRSGPGTRWRPSIHMPRWASRITLEITDVRVQRVQEISEADAQREGWNWSNHDLTQAYDPVSMDTARRWFGDLWDSINAKRGYDWASNPWVWALTFKRVQP